MAFITADRVQETTATAGTGPLALGGAVTADGGSRSFASQMSVADTCEYCIKDAVAGAWEVGVGTYSAVNTLTRTTVQTSSNANAVVSLAGNAATVVFLTLPASRVALIATRAPINNPALTGSTTVTDPTTSSNANLALSATANANGVNLKLVGNGATTPGKTVRVFGGIFQILNNAYTTICLSLSDAGDLTVPGAFSGGSASLSAPLPIGSGGTAAATATLARSAINRGTVALTSAASVTTDASTGNNFTVTLGISATLANPTNLAAGASYAWTIRQDATGGRLLTYGTAFKWPGGTVPTLSTAANAIDLITAISDGTNLYAVASKGFA